MGQISCGLPGGKVRQPPDSKIPHCGEVRVVNRSNSAQMRLAEYNSLLVDELGLIKQLEHLHDDQEQHAKLNEELSKTRDIRSAFETADMEIVEANTFTSYAPGRYRLQIPSDSRGTGSDLPGPVRHLDFSITRLEVPNSHPVPLSVVFVQQRYISVAELVRRVVTYLKDLKHTCETAAQLGRLVTYDWSNAEPLDKPHDRTLVAILTHHLCKTFASTVVDGIPFLDIPMNQLRDDNITQFPRLNDWVRSMMNSTASGAILEFSRLLRIAFKISVPARIVLVFLIPDRMDERDRDSLIDLIGGLSEGDFCSPVILCGYSENIGTESLLSRLLQRRPSSSESQSQAECHMTSIVETRLPYNKSD